MINKIKKYLLRHKEINIYKKNDSGSEYYRVGNSIIRVSDHVPTSNIQPDTLNIIVTGDKFVVMFGNKLINVNDYNSFKSFLKYHIQMCDCFKELINKGLHRESNDYIAREEKRQQADLSAPVEVITIDGVRMGVPEPGSYIFHSRDFCMLTLKGVTAKQLAFLEGKPMQSRESAKRYLQRLKKRNNE